MFSLAHPSPWQMLSSATQRLLLMTLILCLPTRVLADIVEYRLPGTTADTVIVLQGRTQKAGQSMSYIHPKFGRLIMGVGDYKLHPVKTPKQLFERRLFKTKKSGDPDQLMELADWCVRYGLTKEVYKTAATALKIDPDHERALSIKELYRKTQRDLGDSAEEMAYLKQLVPKSGMKFAKSEHYLLYHDTAGQGKDSRATDRLRLLERVYESFLLKFYARGIQLEVPHKRLMVVLFQDRDDFLTFSSKLGPDVASLAGFWHMKTNVAVFFDQGASDRFAAVRAAEQAYQAQKLRRQNVTANALPT